MNNCTDEKNQNICVLAGSRLSSDHLRYYTRLKKWIERRKPPIGTHEPVCTMEIPVGSGRQSSLEPAKSKKW